MNEEDQTKSGLGDVQKSAQGLKLMSIEVESVRAQEKKEISREVTHKESAQQETGHGHQLLSSDGRTEVMINSCRHHTKISLNG